MRSAKPWVYGVVVSILAVAVLAACASEKKQAKSLASQKPFEILVGGGSWPGFFPFLVAQEKGFFAEEGVAVKLNYPDDFTQALLDYENGLYDAAAFPLASLVDTKTRAPDIRMILATDASTTADAVVVRSEIKTIADLKGKRVMALPSAYGELFVSAMLASAQLSRNDIAWVVLNDTDAAVEALKRGEIDALQIWEPYVSKAIANGGHVIFSGADVPGLVISGVAFHEKALIERPDDVQAFLRAWFRAVDYWQANPDEVATLIAAKMQIDPAQVSMNGLHLLSAADNLAAFTPGESYASLEYTARAYNALMIQRGIIDRPVDILSLFDASFIKALK